MEVSKAFNIHGDYKDKLNPPSWDMFLFAEVIFVDKTNSCADPFVYQLNDTAHFPEVSFLINNASSWKDNCLMLGELSELDKKKKLIRLTNKRAVSYKHLIIINGKKPLASTINHEISNALQALADALKVNPNVDSLLLPSWSLRKAKKETAHATGETPSETSNQVAKATHTYFNECEAEKPHFELDAINERLYEIYI